MGRIQVMSFNVGIWTRNCKKEDKTYWRDRMSRIRDFLNTTHPDIICFQELWWPATRYIPKSYKKVPFTGPHHPIYVAKDSGLKFGKGHFRFRWSWADVGSIRIFSIHSHWNDRIFKRNCAAWKKVYEGANASIMAGDFNKPIDQIRIYPQDVASARVCCRFEAYEETYRGFDEPKKGPEYEIDHILFRGPLTARQYWVEPLTVGDGDILMSDHYPIQATFNI